MLKFHCMAPLGFPMLSLLLWHNVSPFVHYIEIKETIKTIENSDLVY